MGRLQSVTATAIDVDMLREQRDHLVEVAMGHAEPDNDQIDGIIHLLDHMLDVAEGVA